MSSCVPTRTQRRFVGPLCGSYYEGVGVGLLIQEGWRIQSESGICRYHREIIIVAGR